MWASHNLSPPPPLLLHPLIPKSPLPLTVVSAKSQPQQDLGGGGGGLGRSILKANSKPTNITAVPKQQMQKQKQEETSRQISGSEVLFAMQKAAAKKRKEAKKKKTVAEGLPSAGRNREDEEKDGVDYSKLRPLCLNSDWGRRLDDLEMRLQELSSNTI